MKTISRYQRRVLFTLLLLAGFFSLISLQNVEARGKEVTRRGADLVHTIDFKQEVKERYPELLEEEPRIAEDFNLPYIQLDSPDAQAFNAQMREIVEEAFRGLGGEYLPSLYAKYKTYLYDDYLSLLLTVSVWTDNNIYFERAYCFHLPTGKLVSNEELLADLGYEGKSVERIAEDSLFYYNRIHQDFDRDLSQMEKTMLGTSLDMLWSGESTTELYLDNVGRLMLNQMIFVPAGSGRAYTQLEALQPVLAGEDALNSLYADIAKELGDFDPYSEAAPKALIAYVGEQDSDDYQTVSEIFIRVASLLGSFERYNVPSLHYNLTYEPGTYESKIDGRGFFLVVPRLERQLTAIGYEGLDASISPLPYCSLDSVSLIIRELGVDEADWLCYLKDRKELIAFPILADEEGVLHDLPAEIYDFSDYLQGIEDLHYWGEHFYDEYESYLSFFREYD